MDIKIIEKTKEIERLEEFKISIDNLESCGRFSEFSFRCVYKNGNIDHFLFPYSEGKWSKKPNKSLLKRLDISSDILNSILFQFIPMGSVVDENISSLHVYDFEIGEDSDD